MHQHFRNWLQTTLCSTIAVTSLLLVATQSALALPVRFGLGPDNNQSLLISHIRSAQENITVNIYSFNHPAVANALIERIDRGVTVRIMIENTPFGAITPDGRQVMAAISHAMFKSRNADHQFFLMQKTDPQVKRRFRYNHAKYVVVDHQRSLISSENFTGSGHANPGEVGNRGWDTIVDDSGVAAQLEDIFSSDSELTHSDVIKFQPVTTPTQTPAIPRGKMRTVPAIPAASGNITRARLITSPDSLDELISLLRSAKRSIVVEHMSLPSEWAAPTADQNPVVTELIHAAQRGVEVRVLLNDQKVFFRKPPNSDTNGEIYPNEVTVDLLNSIGKSERLSLNARIIDVARTGVSYIHNKGIVVDGTKALVSSINGSQTSVMKNREVAILLEGASAAVYYGGAFEFDWNNSGPTRQKKTDSPLTFTDWFSFE